MASITLTDVKIHMGGYNLSGQHNSIDLQHGAEMLDETVFGTSGTRKYKPGLKTFAAGGNIFYDDTSDLVLFNRIGAVREVMSFCPEGNAEGDRAFFVRGVNATYNPISGAIGELLAATLEARSANTPLVRGVLLATGLKSASGNSVGVQLGAVGATQKLYAALHVVSIGVVGTLDVVIESDNGAGFASPTTVATFPQFTGTVGADWQEVVGPITDDYFRAKWTIGGGGTYTVFIVVGIL